MELLRVRPLESILKAQLDRGPLAHAVFRVAEAKHICRAPLQRPILEVGCGSGDFSRACFERPVDVGIDISPSQLHRARRLGAYLTLRCADARELPFESATFGTVLAVSVLEHIPEAHRALAESYRVLRPGGCFVATMPLADLYRYLLWGRIWLSLGMARLCRAYGRLLDRCFGHQTMLGKEQWEQMARSAGFEVLVSKRVVSPRLIMLWDLLLPIAFAELFVPVRALRKPLRRAISRLLDEEEMDGGDLYLVARKNAL